MQSPLNGARGGVAGGGDGVRPASIIATAAIATLPGWCAAAAPDGDACTTPARFQAEVISVLQQAFPERSFRPGASDDVVESGLIQVGLVNLRAEICTSGPLSAAERAEIMRTHFRKGLEHRGSALRWSEARDRVVVQVVPEDYAVRIEAVRRVLVPGIAVVVVIDEPSTYGYVREASHVRWGVSVDELFTRGVDNLQRLTRGKMDAGDGILFVHETDGYDAARILLPALRKAAASVLGNPFRAAMPNRDFLVLWSKAKGAAFDARNAARVLEDFREQPHPVSPLVMEVWEDGTTSVIVPDPRPGPPDRSVTPDVTLP